MNGARQVGKSYIIRYTTKSFFKNYIEINLKDDYLGAKKYNKTRSIESFYLQIGADYGNKINSIDDTIIFLNEIQVYPHLLSMLKTLKLDNRYRFIASGSLLKITLKHTFIPMGSIQEIKMFPLDFEEYLKATNVSDEVIQYVFNCFKKKEKVFDNIHETLLKHFKEYLICGGLLECVEDFVKNRNVFRVREIQTQILEYYKDDATQYDIEKNLKTKTIYSLIASYMENKVKSIQYVDIEEGKRRNLANYQDEFDYLIYSGCTLPTKAIANPKFPLIESASKNLIKLYYNDVGLLTNILYKNNISPLINSDNYPNLGSVYETVCAAELIAHGHELYYFDAKKVGEADFLINDYDGLNVLPLEIKSGKIQNNYRAIPKLVKDPYAMPKGYIFGNKNEIMEKEGLVIYPIYMIMCV